MKNSTHNIAIIGSEQVSQSYLTLLQHIPNVVVKMVIKPQIAAAQHDLFICNDVDAVLIAEVDSNPIQLIYAALKANKHIFCGYRVFPYLILNTDEAALLSSLVSQSCSKLQVEFMRRFDPDYLHLKKQLMEDALGNIHVIKITNRQASADAYVNAFHFNLHDFDMALFMTEQEVDEVFAMNAKKYVNASVVTLKMKSDALVVIASSQSMDAGYGQYIEVFGEKGALIIEKAEPTAVRYYSRKGVMTQRLLTKAEEQYQYINQFKAFFNSLPQAYDILPPTVRDVMIAAHVAEAVQQSIRENKPIKIMGSHPACSHQDAVQSDVF